ncbi:MAG: hypothetical protein UX88_C0006G0018, partial [Candidatus Woesebacteria bacterium GW2011_GWC2_47_16]
YAGNGFDGYFNGSIDEVRIYNRALSPKEVRDLYNWAPGPTAYWNFDEKTGTNLYDRSGNGNNSTAFTGSPAWVSGKYGGALDFNGTTGNVTVPVINSKSITVEGWFYRDVLDTTNADAIFGGWYWVSDGQLRQGYDLRFFINQSTLNWIVETTNGSTVSEVAVTSSALNTGVWYHAAGTYDSTSGKSYLYINGVLSGSATGTAGNTIVPQTQYTDMRIGYSRVNNGYFDGKIDDVRIYNYPRTQKQIVEDMNASHSAPGSPVGSAVGYWKFDEGYGSTTYDSSVNPLNGTLSIGATGSQTTVAQARTNGNAGKFNKGISFDGTDDQLNMGYNSKLNLPNDFTLSFWVYNRKASGTTEPKLLLYHEVYLTSGFRVWINNNNYFQFMTNQSGGNISITSSAPLNQGQWYHLAVTYSGTTATLYINGKANNSGTGTYVASGANYYLAGMGDSRYYYDAIVDEVKIYNSALTEDEVKLDYNHGGALVMGATSTDSSGNPDNSSAREYCIPGDTTSCSAPVAEWKMDEKTGTNAYDTSGNGNTAVLAPGSNQPTWSTGKIGSSLSFDGGDYTTITNNSTLQPTSAITVEAWVKMNSFTDSWLISNQKSTYDANFGYELREDTPTNGFLFRVGNGTTSSSRASATGLSTGVWYHVVGVFDGSNTFIYLNGVGSTGGALTGPIDYTGVASSMYIGQRSDNAFRTNGYIDNVRIFNYARTPAQIAWDYNRGGPVGWWKMDECQGTTANDSSGNGNTGTITEPGLGSNVGVGTCTGSSGTMWKDGATGKFNSSLEFDGTDDRVSIPTSVSLPKITVSAWIKTSTSTEQYITERSNSSYYFATGGAAAGKVCFYLAGASPSWLCSSNRVDDGSWHHVVGTYDGTNKIVYVDGKNVASIGGSGDISSGGSNAINIGVRNNAGSYVNYFNGQIDDVKIYNYGMTPTQIKTLYNDGAVRFGPATGSP